MPHAFREYQHMSEAYPATCGRLDTHNWHAACRRIALTRGNHMKQKLIRFVKDDSGATAIEYGLIAGIVSVAIIAAFALFGADLLALMTGIGAEINPS